MLNNTSLCRPVSWNTGSSTGITRAKCTSMPVYEKNGVVSLRRTHTWFSSSNTVSSAGVSSTVLSVDTSASTPAASDVHEPEAEITRTITPSGST